MYKQCTTCKEEKTLSDFRRDASKPDGLRYECKVCSRLYHQAAYTKKYGEVARQRSNARYLDALAKVDQYRSKGCTVCPEKDIVCMEFHHLDPTQKDFNISTSMNRSWSKIEAELRKCIVLCSNCHKKVHAGKISLEAWQSGLLQQS